MTVADRTGDGRTLRVEEATASVAYNVDGHSNGEPLESEEFVAGSTREDRDISLKPPIEEETEINVAVHAANRGDELVAETITYSIGER